VTTEDGLSKNIGNIDRCIEFEMIEVKVPFDFPGTMGFPQRRDVRY